MSAGDPGYKSAVSDFDVTLPMTFPTDPGRQDQPPFDDERFFVRHGPKSAIDPTETLVDGSQVSLKRSRKPEILLCSFA